MFKKVLLISLAAILLLTSNNSNCYAKSNANPIYDLVVNKDYSYNLDQSGAKEKISFTFKDQVLKVKINGKTAKKITYTDDSLYEAHIQVLDINKNDGHMDLWIYMIGSSDDVSASALYSYENSKLNKIYEDSYRTPNQYTNYSYGYISKIDGKGNFSVCYDRAFAVDCLIGNHYDNIPYKLKDGKVTSVRTNTYSIQAIFTETGSYELTKKTSFLAKANSSSKVSMTLSKGKTVTPVSIYCTNKSLFVKFKTSNGKTGWLDVNKYSFEHMGPFKNIPMFD